MLSSIARYLIKGSALALLGRFLSVAVSLSINFAIARILDPSNVGHYFIVLSIVTVTATISTLGLQQTIVRKIASRSSIDSRNHSGRYIGIAFGYTAVGCVAVLLVFGLFGEILIGSLLNSEPLAKYSLLIGILVAMRSYQSIVVEAFRGFKSIANAVLFNGLASNLILFGILFAYLATRYVFSLDTLLVSMCCSAFLSLIVSIFRLHKHSKVTTWFGKYGGNIKSSNLLISSVPLLLVSVTSLAYTNLDHWILAIFCGPVHVASYGAAAKLVQLISTPLIIVNAVVPPVIAELYSKGKMNELEVYLRGLAGWTAIPAAIAIFILLIWGDGILAFFYGSFYVRGWSVLSILCIGQLVNVMSGSCGITLVMTKNQGALLWISMISSLISISLMVVLARYIGSEGVAIGVLTGVVLQNIAMILYVKRNVGIWTHMSIRHMVRR